MGLFALLDRGRYDVVAPFLNVAVTGRSLFTTCRGLLGTAPRGWSAPSGTPIGVGKGWIWLRQNHPFPLAQPDPSLSYSYPLDLNPSDCPYLG